MKVLSVNVSLTRTVLINGKEVPTGIYKEPVPEAVVHKLSMAGDEQADLTVHGGEHQAVYGYPMEHYGHWESILGEKLDYGTFGENLTTEGLLETEVCIGDVHRMGTAVLQVTSARIPCFKLGHKLHRPDILKPFLQSGYSGFYYRVVHEGVIHRGDEIEVIQRDPRAVTVREAVGMYRLNEGTKEQLQKALSIEALSPFYRDGFTQRLEKLAS